MLTGSDTIESEEIIFYIDLITDFLKKKSVMKSISAFIKEKQKLNKLVSYGIVIFQKDENPVNLYNAFTLLQGCPGYCPFPFS